MECYEMTYGLLNEKINKKIIEIFKDKDIKNMTTIEKRKTIYDYMVENKKYDEELFKKIMQNYHTKNPKKANKRNLYQEFLQPLISDMGVCNGFSQIYKLLLEKIGVFSFCVNCLVLFHDEPIGHQLNLVYDEETDTYSFDDITFGILKKTKTEYFGYDCEEANKKEERQGCLNISKYIKKKWIILDEDIINKNAKREKTSIKIPIEKKVLDNMMQDFNNDFEKYGIIVKSLNQIEKQKTKCYNHIEV